MTVFETIEFDVEDGVAAITLNRPHKYNAISLAMLYELRDAFDLAAADDETKVIVLRAAGDNAFSAGIDLGDGLFEDADNLTATMQASLLPLMETMTQISKPVIASLRGMAVGLAASLAMQCDFLVMADNAELRLVFSKLGIVPDGGACYQLVNRLGYSAALKIALEGQTLDAGQCLDLGVANKVVSAIDLDVATASWARALTKNSDVSQGLTKQLMREAANGTGLLEVAKLETEAQGQCAASDYCIQAYTAFLQKRGSTATSTK